MRVLDASKLIIPRVFRNYSTPEQDRKKSEVLSFGKKLRKLCFSWSGFNQYGLFAHDIINTDISYVQEAVDRLPPEMVDARNFRLMRAHHLSMLRKVLPQEKWITFEEDLAYRYLDPYIKDVIQERREYHEFGDLNFSEKLKY